MLQTNTSKAPITVSLREGDRYGTVHICYDDIEVALLEEDGCIHRIMLTTPEQTHLKERGVHIGRNDKGHTKLVDY